MARLFIVLSGISFILWLWGGLECFIQSSILFLLWAIVYGLNNI